MTEVIWFVVFIKVARVKRSLPTVKFTHHTFRLGMRPRWRDANRESAFRFPVFAFHFPVFASHYQAFVFRLQAFASLSQGWIADVRIVDRQATHQLDGIDLGEVWNDDGHGKSAGSVAPTLMIIFNYFQPPMHTCTRGGGIQRR